MRGSRQKYAAWPRTLALLVLLATGLAAPAAGAAPSLDHWAGLPVLENGRKMPLDTYARQKLLQFSGRSSYHSEPAVRWLATLFFDTERATTEKVFLINHPEVVEALGMAPEERRRYSFNQIEPGLGQLSRLASAAAQIDGKERSVVEAELVRVYGNVDEFLRLARAFQFAVPHEDFTGTGAEMRSKLGLPGEGTPLSFLQVFGQIGPLQHLVEGLQDRAPETWTAEESEAFQLSSVIFQWARHHHNLPPALIPVQGHGQETWLGPWDAIAFVHQDAAVRGEVGLLGEMVDAYRAGQQVEFDLAVRRFEQAVRERVQHDRELRHLALEVRFNGLDLFYRAELFYGLAFLMAFAAFVTGRRWPRRIALALLLVGLAPHTAGIVVRMIIMGRPPVTNLYATFIFVGWVSVVLGLGLEALQKNTLGVTVASFMGLALLLLSRRFGVDGDSMGKVVAVLDSNFWLSTHVVCITLGYAGCVVAGVVGHLYLFQALLRPRQDERLKATQRALFAVLGFGLTFSFFGTMLGGIWADQSWGRFWGWDPKENGALLIVIWCALLFHARLGGMIKEVGMAVGSILGMIVVMFAWIGVNLLGVGLHSYGFTSGLAQGLALYVGLQLLLVAVAGPLARLRLDRARCDAPSPVGHPRGAA